MSITAEALIFTCLEEAQLSQRFKPYVQRAEDLGYPQLAKLFRALVASETAREALFHAGLVGHSALSGDYFVCPHCGLVFHLELPDQCPVDQTPGAAFIVIQ